MLSRTILLCSIFCSASAGAAGTSTSTTTAPAAALGQTLIGLLVILVLIGALAWAARRFNFSGRAHGGILQAQAVLPLGPRERLVLVKAGDVQLLIGVAPGQIQHIHTFTEPLPAAVPETTAPGFKDALQALLKRAGEPRS